MKLSPVLSDGMILQRAKECMLWGTSEPGAMITCHLMNVNEDNSKNEVYSTSADSEGKWMLNIPPHPAGGPYDIVLNDGKETVLHDVLFGDVWVLGGQSNMELPILRTLDLYKEEASKIDDPDIRLFEVPKEYDFHGTRDELCGGKWLSATKEYIMGFSAVGYFYAKELKERYKVPIGLLQTAVGGTPIEAWLPENILRLIGGYEKDLDACKDDAYVQGILADEENKRNAWMKETDEIDTKGELPHWRPVTVPGLWEHNTGSEVCHGLDGINGCIWLRKEIEIPEDIFKKEISKSNQAKVILGALVDADEVFLNDKKIGETGYKYPPRNYTFPAEIVKQGKNVLKIRLMVHNGRGGFIPDKKYEFRLGEYTVPLSGTWEYQVGAVMREFPAQTFFQYKPSGCYNAMIYPIRHYEISGICFYQGESNSGRAKGYRQLFTALVTEWRRLFRQADLPFMYVQLTHFTDSFKNLKQNDFSELREEQRHGLEIKNTAMVTSIDVGEYNDLHPQNKKSIAQRIALGARKLVYGEDIVISGPLFTHQICFPDRIVLHFTSVGSGLIARGERLFGFEVCGDNGIYKPAEAVIEGDTVIVFSPKTVWFPKYVRYAWLNNLDEANLYNKEGLPASPFRTKEN